MNLMSHSLLKYKLITKSFVTITRANKYKDISSGVKTNPIKVPEDMHEPEKYGNDTKAPKPGEIYHLPAINSKLLALEMGYTNAFKRDPVSAYYSMKVKDVVYHVFNAARTVLITYKLF